ncbi:MAG TPA: preprotein translocase subunit SecG [Patescibacteria group bacterium]|nr:preprotein translocase subunit SecG [Patescibacteria group bacterium]
MIIIFAIQIITAIVVIGLILIQSKGTGLGRAFGSSFSSSFTRRGLEKLIFKGTFVATAVFIVISIWLILL